MIKYLTLFFFIIPYLTFAQINANTVDAENGSPIPYVNIWVEGENIGTTSSEMGEFSLPEIDKNKYLIFSALGYESLRLKIENMGTRISLSPKAVHLAEIKVSPRKGKKNLAVGSFNKKAIDVYAACGGTPWITAKFMKYEDNYKETPHIQKFKVLTSSKIKNAVFNVRLYTVNQNGKPEGYLFDKNIVGYARKGNKETEIDVSHLNLKVPEEGFFFAVEWLIIDANKYELVYTVEGSKKKKRKTLYSPKFGMQLEDKNENAWVYVKGDWKRKERNPDDFPFIKSRGKVSTLAVEMTLSD